MKKPITKNYIIPLTLALTLTAILSVFKIKDGPSFDRYDNHRSSSFSIVEVARGQKRTRPHRSPSSYQKENHTRKVDQTVNKYESLKDLPPGLIPLKSIDQLAIKFTPERKSSLGEKSLLLLEVIPTHYFIDQTIDQNYTIKIRTLEKGISTAANVTIKDDRGEFYPIFTIGKGLYEMRIPATRLTEGKTYFNILAKTKNDEAFTSLALESHPHYFDFIRSNDQGLDAEGNLFFSNSFHFYKKANYLIEGVVYHNEKPLVQTSTLLKNVKGEV